MIYALLILAAYLMGSIPFAFLITKMMGKGDIRNVGSGNIGATNVMRAGGFKMAGLVWLLDMAKAFSAVLLAKYITGDIAFAAICGFFAIVGHNFPVWLKFKGGKGISCTFGFMLGVNPLFFIICGIQWLIGMFLTGYSSAGAIIAILTLPILGFAMAWEIGCVCLAVTLLGLWQHRGNIKRLISGTEDKIKWRWKK